VTIARRTFIAPARACAITATLTGGCAPAGDAVWNPPGIVRAE